MKTIAYPNKHKGSPKPSPGSRTILRPAEVFCIFSFIVNCLVLALYPVEVHAQEYLGRLSKNKYSADSTSNTSGRYGNSYSSQSVNNPNGRYGSPYSVNSATNQYTTKAPRIYAADGTYLGKLSNNPYDADSVSNPYGRYGSKYSATSINNPNSAYGSQYSSQSPNNPYANNAPVIIGGEE